MISDVRRADLIEQLAEVTLDAGTILDDASWLDQLTGVCTAARIAFGAAAVSVAHVEHDHLRYVAASGLGADVIVGTQLPLGRGLAGYVAVSGQALAIDEPASDPRFARDVAERTGYVPRTLLLVPMIGRTGSAAGVLTVLDRTMSTVDALELSTAFAELATPTLSTLGETTTAARILIDAFADAVATAAPHLAPSMRRALQRHPGSDDGVLAIAATLNGVRRLDPAARDQVVAVVDAVVELAARRRGR